MKMVGTNRRLVATTLTRYLLFVFAVSFAREQEHQPPDLTIDQTVECKQTYNLGATGLRGVLAASDPKLLYPAIRAVAQNPDGMAWMRLSHTFTDQLTLADMRALAPELLTAIKSIASATTPPELRKIAAK